MVPNKDPLPRKFRLYAAPRTTNKLQGRMYIMQLLLLSHRSVSEGVETLSTQSSYLVTSMTGEGAARWTEHLDKDKAGETSGIRLAPEPVFENQQQ